MKHRFLLVPFCLLLLASCSGGSAAPPAPAAPLLPPLSPGQADAAASYTLGVLRSASGVPLGVRVSWPRVNVAGVQGYYIYRDTASLPAGPANGLEDKRVDGGNLVSAGNPGSGTSTRTFDDLFSAVAGNTYYYRLTVVNSTGNESDLSAELSIAIAPHTITTVTQSGGEVGDEVTINGTWFGGSRAGDLVYFSNSSGELAVAAAAADYVSWSQTQIVVKVPYGAADGKVAVEVSGMSVENPAGQDFDYSEPVLTMLSPDNDWADNNWITLSGSAFGPAPDAGGAQTKIWFGAAAAENSDIDLGAWTTTEINLKVPAAALGQLVQVRVDVAGSFSGGLDFTVLPQLDSLSAASAAALSEITLNGSGFGAVQGGGSVSINGTAASVVNWSNNAVTVTIPAAALDGPVQLLRGDAAIANTLDLDVIPVILSADPFRRMPGEQLTISGGGFGAVQGAGSVLFLGGSVPVSSYISWSASEIVIVVPAGAATGKLRVAVDDSPVGADQDSAESSADIQLLLPAPGGWGEIGQL